MNRGPSFALVMGFFLFRFFIKPRLLVAPPFTLVMYPTKLWKIEKGSLEHLKARIWDSEVMIVMQVVAHYIMFDMW